MKIVAINGSHRKTDGFTQFMLTKIGEGAKNAGADYEIIKLSSKEINDCVSCGRCQKESGKGCVFSEKDDVNEIYEKIRACDLVIYATPIYVFQMSSLLKKLFERFYSIGNSSALLLTKSGLTFHEVDKTLCGKRFAVVVCCDNMERKTTQNVLDYFNNFAQFFDTDCAGYITRNSAGYFQSHPNAKQFSTVQQGLVLAGEELATKSKISTRSRKMITKSILPIPEILLSILKRTTSGREKLLANMLKFKSEGV